MINSVDSASLAFHSFHKSSALLIDTVVNQDAVSLANCIWFMLLLLGTMKISINCYFLLCYPVYAFFD